VRVFDNFSTGSPDNLLDAGTAHAGLEVIHGDVRHFADYALARSVHVVGSYRWRSKTENIEHILGNADTRTLAVAFDYLALAPGP